MTRRICAQIGFTNAANRIAPMEAGRADRLFARAAELGVTDVRSFMGWSSHKPISSSWEEPVAARYDAIVTAAAANGLGVIGMMANVPCWASDYPGKSCTTYDGRVAATAGNPSDYATLVAATTAMCDRWNLAAIEVWNEPNAGSEPWALTAAQCKAHHQAVRDGVTASTRPATPVIGCSLAIHVTNAADAAEYLEDCYAESGFKDTYDYQGQHFYGLDLGTTPWTQVDPLDSLPDEIDLIRSKRTAAGDSKPIAVTEFGYTSSTYGGAITAITEQQKGDWLADGLLWQADQPDIFWIGFFNLLQAGVLVNEFGVLDPYGVPLRSYYIVKEAIEEIQAA